MRILLTIFVVVLAFACVQSHEDYEEITLVFRQKGSSGDDESLLVVLWEENDDGIATDCGYYTNKDKINEILSSSNIPKAKTVSKEYMQELLSDCDSVSYPDADEGREATTSSPSVAMAADTETTTAGYDGIPVIFPGTKWCGAGDRAKDYDDLGLHQDTDRCCRAHDLCNDTLAPGESKNNLTNDSKFTKLSCQCDEDFYNCLDRVNSVTSNTIGNMYFNILKRECYKADYPNTKKCLKYRTIFKIKCVKYEKNKKAPQVYQWVKAKKYKNLPFPGPLTITLPF